jgi:hypothetical protein
MQSFYLGGRLGQLTRTVEPDILFTRLRFGESHIKSTCANAGRTRSHRDETLR